MKKCKCIILKFYSLSVLKNGVHTLRGMSIAWFEKLIEFHVKLKGRSHELSLK